MYIRAGSGNGKEGIGEKRKEEEEEPMARKMLLS
jgi:hypothetical protein